MQMPQWLLVSSFRKVAVEIFVLLVSDLGLRLDPDWGLIIDVFLAKSDGVRNESRILSENMLQPYRPRVFVEVFFEVKTNLGAAFESVYFVDCEATGAIGFPAPTLLLGIAAGQYLDSI